MKSWNFEELFYRACYIVGAFFVLCLLYLVVRSICADGKIDYCHIRQSEYTFHLEGHRPWRDDYIIGHFTTLEEAKKDADILNCEVK